MPLYRGFQSGGSTGTSQPQLVPATANFTESVTVTATGDTANSELRYTTDGTQPTEASALYAGSITFSNTTTLRLRAFAPGFIPSAGATGSYTLLPLLPATVPAVPTTGVGYEYFQGTWSRLPNFDALTPLKTGVQPGFALAPSNRADFFGFRFTGRFWAPTNGLYAFRLGSDDGSTLSVDGQQVVGNDGQHGYQERRGEIGLATGQHRIGVNYFDYNGDQALVVQWRPPGAADFAELPATALQLRGAENPHGAVEGLDYRYVEGNGGTVADVSARPTIRSGSVATFDLSPRRRATAFGFEFTGFVNIPIGGLWNFFTESDDGTRLFLGDTEVVNNDGVHGLTEVSGALSLAPGRHALRLVYAQGTGGFGLNVRWRGPGLTKSAIPAAALWRQPPFARWQQRNFTPAELADPTLSGPEADFDRDGMSNFLEYALGLPPKADSTAAAPAGRLLPGTTGRQLYLTYTRSKKAPDVTVTPQVSVDLIRWVEGPAALETVSVVDGGDFETVTVRDRMPESADSRRFLRLLVAPVP